MKRFGGHFFGSLLQPFAPWDCGADGPMDHLSDHTGNDPVWPKPKGKPVTQPLTQPTSSKSSLALDALLLPLMAVMRLLDSRRLIGEGMGALQVHP